MLKIRMTYFIIDFEAATGKNGLTLMSVGSVKHRKVEKCVCARIFRKDGCRSYVIMSIKI